VQSSITTAIFNGTTLRVLTTNTHNQSVMFELTNKVDSTHLEFSYSYNSLSRDGQAESGTGTLILTQGAAPAAIEVGNVQYTTFDLTANAYNNSTVGDKFVVNTVANGGASDKMITLEYNSGLTGDSWATSGKVILCQGVLTDTTTEFKFQQIDVMSASDAYGNAVENKFDLTFGTVSNANINGQSLEFTNTSGSTAAAAFEVTANGSTIGQIATGSTKVYDSDKFWDASGNFILSEPKTITLVQGNGNKASFTVSSADTFDDVAAKINTAIADGLGQGAIVGELNDENFVNYVSESEAQSSGLESVAGTFVIRSAVAGSDGEITFSGDDDLLNALSLTTIQESEDTQYTIDVTNAHTGDAVATDVKVSENKLIGIVHENVDVEFDANTGIKVAWNSDNKDFVLTGGGSNSEDTFVHLADRTMVLHVGANQKQDIGMGIGNMGSESLGVDNIQVTSNQLANEAIGTIDSAISRVSGERSKLGALQNRLDHTINNLGVTMENLTSAESRIRDADMAKEMMEFTKLQILSQSANAMLSQANQLPNNVLQLLR